MLSGCLATCADHSVLAASTANSDKEDAAVFYSTGEGSELDHEPNTGGETKPGQVFTAQKGQSSDYNPRFGK